MRWLTNILIPRSTKNIIDPNDRFMQCDYKEFQPETYKGVIIEDGHGNEIRRYFSGCFNSDLRRAQKNFPHAMEMGSINNFRSDDPENL